MKAGPKKDADLSPLPWRPRTQGAEQLRLFAEKFLTVPRGKGAGHAMKLRPWQVDMSGTLLNDERVKTAVWILPRGQGKSGLAAAIGLHHIFMSGIEGARCAIVAQDERSAQRMLKTAARMVELNDELAARAVIFRDRIEVPGNGSVMLSMPAEAHRVEGEDLSLAILDEVGFMRHETFEAAVLSVGKSDTGGQVLAIGTPSPPKWRELSPLHELVIRGRSEPDDPAFKLVEYSAPQDAPIDDPATWAMANPAYGDWLTEATISEQLKVSRESEFRRARLGQWMEHSAEPAFDPELWRKCERKGVRIPRGSKVVVAFDGSLSGDSTALIVGSVSKVPHLQLGGLWEPHKTGEEVNQAEVEERIKQLCREFKVVEIVADPFRFLGMLQRLDDDGYPVIKFDQSPRRQTPATLEFRAAVAHGKVTHSGERMFNTHMLRATLEEKQTGVKLVKPTKNEKIDLAVAALMAFNRCVWLGSPRRREKRKMRSIR